MLQLIKNNYRQNKIGYICIWLVILEKIISVARWAYISSANGMTRDTVLTKYGHCFEDYYEKNTNISVFCVSDSTVEAFIFAIITIIVIGGVFILSLRNRQNPPKRYEQILYTSLMLSAYSGLLLGLSYWLGQISILLRIGGAGTINSITHQLNLPFQELIFIVSDICLILSIYSAWRILSDVFKKSKMVGWISSILAVIIIYYIIFCYFASWVIVAHYL